MLSRTRWIVAVGLALYLYFLLPATATLFYELYHVVKIDAIYWVYSGFKFAGYYFNEWAYQIPACIAVALLVLLPPLIFRKKSPGEYES